MPEVIRGFMKRESNELSAGKITVPQMFILCYLYKEKSARMTDIARHLYVTTAAATGLVDRLVKLDLVAREYDASDRRIIKIVLSSKGSALFQKIWKQKVARVQEVFCKIPEQERVEYLRILRKIKETIEQE